METISDFLMKWGATPDAVDMDAMCDRFIKSMQEGLDKDNMNLAMFPTYIGGELDLKEGDSVIVIDAGGTNLRTCLVTFDSQLKPVISDFNKTSMPGIGRNVPAKEFFATFADQIERLIDKSDNIGWCFSYAAKITEDHDGIPTFLSKEIKATEVVGMRLGKSLLDELASRGIDVSKKKIAIINDTVATLLAGKANGNPKYDGYIGFILGTGTNTAYVEKNSSIGKIRYTEGSQVINVESGGFEYENGELDRLFFNTTKDPEVFHLEKMIGGAYLGPMASILVTKAVEAGLLTADFGKKFSQIDRMNTTDMSIFLSDPFDAGSRINSCVTDENDRETLYLLFDSVVARAAKMTAVNLAAAVLKSGCGANPLHPVCINADGTTFYKTKNLRRYTEYYLTQFLQLKHHRYFEFVTIDQSPVIGAAIGGLSL